MDRHFFKVISLLLFLLSSLPIQSQTPKVLLEGVVSDSISKEAIADVALQLEPLQPKGKTVTLYSNENGKFSFGLIPMGSYTVYARYLGQVKTYSLTINSNQHLSIVLRTSHLLREVVVTASEGKRITSSSKIERAAIDHLQPTSFSDLTALLPGGRSSTPNIGNVNNLLLRETGTLNASGAKSNNPDYAISSLGTLFVIDGAPLETDGNLQYSASSTGSLLSNGKINLNRGVDMRTLATDNIESVEFIRGVPSVEYGNITSGVVLVKRKSEPIPLGVRTKVDGYSKLYSAEKGVRLTNTQTLIGDISFLDAKPDPRIVFESYKRVTGSIRYYGESKNKVHRWEVNSDYTGSFDKNKVDPDLSYGNVDEFLSDYNRISISSKYKYLPPTPRNGLQRFETSISVSQQFDYLQQRKLVAPDRMTITPTASQAGEHEATLLGGEYIANYISDGKPFSLYAKSQARYKWFWGKASHRLKTGVDYSITKNFGRGQVYDISHPPFPKAWDSRPRAYYTIPALQQLALYAEDYYSQPLNNHLIAVEAGIRFSCLLGLNPQFALHNKIYAEPRTNFKWQLPQFSIGEQNIKLSFDTGWGLTTRMPTLNYLYPDLRYIDITQLAYYDINKPFEHSLFNVRTYIEDATNYQLLATRNRKFDLRVSIGVGKNTLAISYFNEKMTTGFRYKSTASVYNYNKYDVTGIDYSILTQKPDINTIPFSPSKRIDAVSRPENGSMIHKEGVEFQFSSQRIPFINTAFILNGAWFRSTYSNSVPLFYAVHSVLGDVIIADNYVGLYNWKDGSENQSLTTNLLFDTQIPHWGIIITTAVEASWFISRQRLPQQGRPIAYLDVNDGLMHPYTNESAMNTYLRELDLTFDRVLFERSYVPLDLGINLKVSKQLGKYFTLSLFANNVIDYLPDYKIGNATIRRTASPYFGMEMRIKL